MDGQSEGVDAGNIRLSYDASSRKRRILRLSVYLAGAPFLGVAVAVVALYHAGFSQQEQRLEEIARTRARMVEAVAAFDSAFGAGDHEGGAFAATLHQLEEAHAAFPGFGQTGEFTLSERRGDSIVFLLTHRHEAGSGSSVPIRGEMAEPARRALEGGSGTMVGLDYRGKRVLGAFEPANAAGRILGVVAKIDLQEIRRPYLVTGFWAGGISLLFLAVVLTVFRRTAAQLVSETEERERLFTGLFENALVGVALHEIVTDADGHPVDYRFLIVNPAFEKLTGLQREVVEGRTLLEVLPGEAEGPFIETYGRVALTGEPVTFEETSSELGKYFGIYASSPKPGQFAVIFVDITARVEATREIEALNRTLEERIAARTADLKTAHDEMESFTYSVSHDLRVPLRAVDGYATLLRKNHASALNSEGQRFMDEVLKGSSRMREIIDDLLMLSRLGGSDLNRERLDMTGLVAEVIDSAREDFPGRDLGIRLGSLPEAMADGRLIRQAWDNLIRNALKFTRDREQAEISISGEADRDGAVYVIEDNGAGFDMAYADQLFAPFKRLHPSSSFDGTGIGLSIVQRIVRRHGGQVEGAGKVGEGARFRFTLPNGDGGYPHGA